MTHPVRSRYPETSPDEDWESALAAAVFAATDPRLIPRQRAGIVDGCIWLLTERTPSKKYQTRYRSKGALGVEDKRLLAHEHVVQRKGLIDRVLATTSPAEIAKALSTAVGCTILRTEHSALSANKGLDGWERYRAADIRVYDCGPEGNQEPREVPWSELGLPAS